ncbi:hypothetical protein L3X38_031905 [Prunus dulcis]|uniref:DUF7746 domain-containing protein n=1 Tax=Prunus dulcis TaxID=3755 RepID=A0AAD4VDF0_PRUDU|nr:hypothetical protein L3X38_031905 [Prunus dulcis]
MVANSYVANHGFRQSEIVPLLEVGFTGTLRSWWDKHLVVESNCQIIHAIKLNEEGLPIFDENLGQETPTNSPTHSDEEPSSHSNNEQAINLIRQEPTLIALEKV